MAPGVSSHIERRKFWRKQVAEDRDEVLIEVCLTTEKTCEEVKGLKDDVGTIKDDVSDIKTRMANMEGKIDGIENQNEGMKDLLTEHVDHHPKMRMKVRTTSEKIWLARYQLTGLVVTAIVSITLAIIGSSVVGG